MKRKKKIKRRKARRRSNRDSHWNRVVKAANEDGVADMVRRGYNINAFSIRTQTPRNFDTHDREYRIPALFWACSNDDRIGLLKNLVRLGANVNIQDNTGYAATHVAASNGSTNTLKYLAQFGADFSLVVGRRSDVKDPQSGGFLPVHYAVKNDHAEALEWLFLHYPAQIQAKLNNGLSPAMLAVYLGHLDALRVCAKHDDLTRDTELVEQAAFFQHKKIFKFLTQSLGMAVTPDVLNYAKMGEDLHFSKSDGKMVEQMAALGTKGVLARCDCSDESLDRVASRGSSVATKVIKLLCAYCGSCKPKKKYFKCSNCLMISYCNRCVCVYVCMCVSVYVCMCMYMYMCVRVWC